MKGYKTKIQEASDTPFDNSTNGLTSDNVQDAILEASSPPIETLTEFESFSSPGLESTTSNSLIVKSGYPYTTATKTAGEYVIDHTATVGNNSNNKESRHTVEWRLGTSGSWTTAVDISKNFIRGGDVELRSGFFSITLATSGVFQVRIRYANPGGGSCIIEEANIKIGKVSS
jgi:hypothetical protein